jgi:hypothetical protein
VQNRFLTRKNKNSQSQIQTRIPRMTHKLAHATRRLRLAQVQEPGSASGEARGGGGLGPMTEEMKIDPATATPAEDYPSLNHLRVMIKKNASGTATGIGQIGLSKSEE